MKRLMIFAAIFMFTISCSDNGQYVGQVEKKKMDKYLNNIAEVFAEKLCGSSGGQVQSVTLSMQELVLTVSHPNCEQYDSVFLDFCIVCDRAEYWDKITPKFKRVVLNFQCGGKTTKYFVTKDDLFRYLSNTVNDSFLKKAIQIK